MKEIFDEKNRLTRCDDAYRTIIISIGFSFHFRIESSICDTLIIIISGRSVCYSQMERNVKFIPNAFQTLRFLCSRQGLKIQKLTD